MSGRTAPPTSSAATSTTTQRRARWRTDCRSSSTSRTPPTGSGRRGKDIDSLTPLFDFSFILHPAGHPTTVGEWHGAEESYYLLQISSPDKFTITVTPKRLGHTDGDDADALDDGVTIYSLKKTSQPTAKSFLQQYGTYLMLAVFFVVNMYLKTKTAATTASSSAVAPPTTAVTAKKTK